MADGVVMRKITLDVDPDDYHRFYAIAQKHGGASKVMRHLIRKYLQAVDDRIDRKRGAELRAAEMAKLEISDADLEALIKLAGIPSHQAAGEGRDG